MVHSVEYGQRSYPFTGLYRSLVFQEVEAPIIFKHLAHEVGKVASTTDRLPLHRRRYLKYSFLLEVTSTPGATEMPEELGQ